jgi:hypothetical protein
MKVLTFVREVPGHQGACSHPDEEELRVWGPVGENLRQLPNWVSGRAKASRSSTQISCAIVGG